MWSWRHKYPAFLKRIFGLPVLFQAPTPTSFQASLSHRYLHHNAGSDFTLHSGEPTNFWLLFQLRSKWSVCVWINVSCINFVNPNVSHPRNALVYSYTYYISHVTTYSNQIYYGFHGNLFELGIFKILLVCLFCLFETSSHI